ncbi:MAG: HTH domain-containing protein [Lachnospiraceae bacterium]|nr:HTH domain-containing protein [Lachnospiraceae bacterium]
MTTKDRVLGLLRKENKGFVSGETMSRELGVTRASINKAIQALRNEGYEIDSINNRGYRIVNAPDLLNTAELSCRLPGERMERILCLDSVSSTNVRLSELAYEGAEDSFVVIANEQTSGRGRRGRSFASPKDKGIYFSYLMRREEAPADVTGITAWTAVAVLRAIRKVLGLDSGSSPMKPGSGDSSNAQNDTGSDSVRNSQTDQRILGIKWVNDLVMNGKKLCGILTEMSIENETGRIQSIIIGIGVNVNEEASDFDKNIRDIATSLFLETGKIISRAELAAEMVRQLDEMNRDFPEKKQEYLEEYRQYSLILGRTIQVYDARAMDVNGAGNAAGGVSPVNVKSVLPAPKTAKAVAINDDFSLKIEEPNGTTSDVSSGEVSVRW